MNTSFISDPGNASPGSHLWFKHGPTRFGLRVNEVVEVVTLPECRRLPMSDPALLGFSLYHGQVLPVFDPVSLAGLTIPHHRQPLTAAVVSVRDRPALAIAVTGAGTTVDLEEAGLAPAGGRVSAAFRGEQSLEEDPLLVLDPEGLLQAMGLSAGETAPTDAAA